MAQDGEDAQGLEHRQTLKVPDQTTAELIQELEADVTNPRIPLPRRGGTYTALVPPPAQPAPTPAKDDAEPEENEVAFEPEWDEPAGRKEWVRWAVIVASIAGIVVLGLGAWSSFVKIQKREAPGIAQAERASAPPSPAPARVSAEKAPEPQAAPEAGGAPEPKAESTAVANEPEPVPGAEDEEKEAQSEGTGDEEGDAPDEVDGAVLAKALKRRKIRELDALLVSRESKKRRSFAKAESYCRDLEVAGVSGWRLPEVGELVSLGGARLVRRYTFWSSTPGDAQGKRRLAWDAKRRRIRPLSPKWRGGRTVCVRSRP